LITCGGVQSNHARATAAAGSALGLRVVLVLNGAKPARPVGNTNLGELFGADIRYVASRDLRAPTMDAVAEETRASGRTPFIVPLGASNATGAMGFARGVAEIATAGLKPDLIIHSSSSGGTQAGLVAGCALFGMRAKVLGVSVDDPAASLAGTVRGLLTEMATRLGASPATIGLERDVEIDDTHVGGGYGVPTPASTEALQLVARTEGIVLDPTYTAKAMAGLIARIRRGAFTKDDTILFWHTGGAALTCANPSA
jgi:1-aminocyclopropane-1-carboxylate deaminase/D-cysteine desulfhydrase-like pyridoxal-dependent ACC family enzyme